MIMDINENVTMETNENTTSEVSTTTSVIETNTVNNITFKKPYQFEGQTYEGIDLSNIESLSTKNLLDADKLYTKQGNISPTAEMTLAYACIVASITTKKPIEFFINLPANEGMKVKTAVINFLYN
jgi:hypothetical protein